MQTPAPTSLLRLLVSNELNTPGDRCAAFGSMLHWVGLRAIAFDCMRLCVAWCGIQLLAFGCMRMHGGGGGGGGGGGDHGDGG